MTTPPAIRLANLRRLARKAIRTDTKLDPRQILAIIEGKEKA